MGDQGSGFEGLITRDLALASCKIVPASRVSSTRTRFLPGVTRQSRFYWTGYAPTISAAFLFCEDLNPISVVFCLLESRPLSSTSSC